MGELRQINFKAAVPAENPDRLETVSGVDSAGPQVSLEFALMAAVRHAECGDHQAFVTAVCDAVWIAYEGRHERLANVEVIGRLRSLAGFSWEPPRATDGDAA